MSRRYFFVRKLKIEFYFLHELKQKRIHVTGRHLRPVDSEIDEGVKTTRSNRNLFFSVLGTFQPKTYTGAFHSNNFVDVRQV